MFFSKRSIASFSALTSVVALTSFLAMKSVDNFNFGVKLPDDFPVNNAENVTFTQIDQNGEVKYIMKSNTLVRYENGRSKLDGVNILTYSQSSKKPWKITSAKALIFDENNKVDLSGGVLITRDQDGPSSPPIRVATESGTLYPKKDHVETNKLVTLTQPGSDNIMTGVGLKGDLNPVNLTLLSKVRAYYDDQPKN